MCVKVFLAEDSEPVRKAIRILLSECKDISVVGEAATLSEAIQKTAELQPDVIIFDLHMADGEKERLPAGPKLIAISFANDDEAKASADSIGAAKLLDKMELAQELIPTILEQGGPANLVDSLVDIT
jgi:two-component system, NarL family, response regulator DevR